MVILIKQYSMVSYSNNTMVRAIAEVDTMMTVSSNKWKLAIPTKEVNKDEEEVMRI